MKKIQYLTSFNYYKQQEIKKGGFYQSPHRGETFNNVAGVESRVELVRAMPRQSNVSKKHRKQFGDYQQQQCVSRRDATKNKLIKHF